MPTAYISARPSSRNTLGHRTFDRLLVSSVTIVLGRGRYQLMSAFISVRSDRGMRCACPSLMQATRTDALTSTAASARSNREQPNGYQAST